MRVCIDEALGMEELPSKASARLELYHAALKVIQANISTDTVRFL